MPAPGPSPRASAAPPGGQLAHRRAVRYSARTGNCGTGQPRFDEEVGYRLTVVFATSNAFGDNAEGIRLLRFFFLDCGWRIVAMVCSARFLVRLVCLVLFLSALALAGCGPRVGTVSGKVTYKNAPLPSGTITFLGGKG